MCFDADFMCFKTLECVLTHASDVFTVYKQMDMYFPGYELLASCPWGPATAHGVGLLTEMYAIYMDPPWCQI